MHQKKVITAGKPLAAATKALIMVHGRGGSAADILSLSTDLNIADFALLAPQAANHTWYPYSFMAPQEANEPWLSAALDVLKNVLTEVQAAGIPTENIYLLGFSQGACLTLEFAARNATRFGGVVAFSGGLIGQTLHLENYQSDFLQTPIFLGCSDVDPHIPLQRVHESAAALKDRNAHVFEKIYPGMTHTIIQDEINWVNTHIFSEGNCTEIKLIPRV